MDWVQQVQVTRDSSCGDNLLYGLPVKDNSVVVVQFYCVCGFLFSFVLLLVFLCFFFFLFGFFFPPYVSFVVCHPQLFLVMMLSTLRRASCGDKSINLLRSEVSFVKRILLTGEMVSGYMPLFVTVMKGTDFPGNSRFCYCRKGRSYAVHN